jgi:hypothetical protein
MKHLDDARDEAIQELRGYLSDKPRGWRILLVEDAFAMLRLIVWCPKRREDAVKEVEDELEERLARCSGPYWSRAILFATPQRDPSPDREWQEDAWEEALEDPLEPRLRVRDRVRVKTTWLAAPVEPPWNLGRVEPPLVVFYSFKGGVGRSTALAATALQLAGSGSVVALLDADLDAPGVATMFLDSATPRPGYGIVDYLLEQPILEQAGAGSPRLEDYFFRASRDLVTGSGELLVFPAGTFNQRYMSKLARLDHGAPPGGGEHPFLGLLRQIREEIAPDWILIDSRAGLGDVSGFLLGGICHLHVILASHSEQNWQGLRPVLEGLGARRLREGRPQAECILVAAMLPGEPGVERFERAVLSFSDRAEDVFKERYYAEQGEDFWTVQDAANSSDAPHIPEALPYNENLALFCRLSEVAGLLRQGGPYVSLVKRIGAVVERLRESTA